MSLERKIPKRKGLHGRLKAAIDGLREALDDNSPTLPKLEGLATKVRCF